MTPEEAHELLRVAARGSLRHYMDAAVKVAQAGLAYTAMVSLDAAWAERVAQLEAVLRDIVKTETHAAKICGTCHTYVDRADQLIDMARRALDES